VTVGVLVCVGVGVRVFVGVTDGVTVFVGVGNGNGLSHKLIELHTKPATTIISPPPVV
jgi:hypothetical protein